jgi:PAS domain S-box-containing protein
LANIGSWSWDIATDKVVWSDELYRIFGLEPSIDKIDFEKFTSFIHPDDKEAVVASIKTALQDFKTYEITHRVQLKNGTVRIIQSKGEPLLDVDGKPFKLIGTAQNVTERQQLIDNLERNEALYKQAQELANLGNWTFDLKSKIIHWSDELYNIYEVPKGTLITYDFFLSFVHPDDLEGLVTYFDNCLKNKLPYDRKHRIILKSGKAKVLHRKGEVKLDVNGEILEIFGTTQDITKQQAIENELKENQIFIQKITDATPSIITSYNINTGKYVFISEGLNKLLGYETDVALTKGVQFFIEQTHPDDIDDLMKKNAKAIEEANANPANSDVVIEFIYRMRHKNGNYRWFHTYGTIFDRNSNNLVEHVLNISLDVTEQIEASLKIKEQEHFIQQIADASPTILYLFETESNSISYINNEIFYVLKHTPEEIIKKGSSITESLYHPEDYNLLPERIHSTKSFEHQNSMMQYECRMKRKDGSWCWLLVREIIFKKDDDGKIQQILGAALDITQRKEMEKTLLQNAFQLEQSNASLEEFAYVASHDLKEPLRKIATFGDRIVNTQLERLTDDGKVYIKKIIDASQRMQIMITDLLSVSMISGDRSFQTYSLKVILDDALQALEHKIEQKNAVIEAHTLPDANVVPSQFRQLFQNLLSNSLKFVPDGVKPVIRIKHSYLAPSELKHLQVKKAARYHCLQIIDNGIGFEEEYTGKIFTIFQRLHGRSEYEGTGIGLAICKKIVEHHGGVIYANSKLGEGATFTVILPE